MTTSPMELLNQPIDLWNEAWKHCLGDKDLTNARVAGRATKANPNKEDVTQWQVQGKEWVASYISWRKNNPDWKIWTTPDGRPAIELDLVPEIAGVQIKMGIDRVFEVNGKLIIVDLKTSQQVPASALQLGFYKYGIESIFGVPADFGTYYMARTSGTSEIIDLSWYTEEKLEYLVSQFDTARKARIFMPNADSCNLCGFTKICQFTSKKEKV